VGKVAARGRRRSRRCYRWLGIITADISGDTARLRRPFPRTPSGRGHKIIMSADWYERGRCVPAIFGVRVAPAHDELRNWPNSSERESTSCRSTDYGSGHLIRVFRDSWRIFSLLFLLSHPVARWSIGVSDVSAAPATCRASGSAAVTAVTG